MAPTTGRRVRGGLSRARCVATSGSMQVRPITFTKWAAAPAPYWSPSRVDVGLTSVRSAADGAWHAQLSLALCASHPSVQPTIMRGQPFFPAACAFVAGVMSATAVFCRVRLDPNHTGKLVRGGARVYALFRPPLPFAPGVCPARAPGSGGAPPWWVVSGSSLYSASCVAEVAPSSALRPRGARELHFAYCRAAQWRHTLREARLHDHHRTNVGFALGTRYRVSSYRGARVLRLSAVFVHCFRSHFGSRLESLPGVYAPRVCWPDLRVDCVPVEVFTCSRRTASCTSGERLAVPRYNHPYTLVYLPGYLNHPSRVLGGSPASPHVKQDPVRS